MANYLLLYHGGKMGETQEEKEALMSAWNTWMQQCGDNLVDAGNPTSNVMSVKKDGSSEFMGDRVSGYTVIKADSMDDALKAASMTPPVVGGTGSVDVYETIDPASMM